MSKQSTRKPRKKANVIRVTIRPTLAYCEGCNRTFQNVDGCDVCQTDRYIRKPKQDYV